MSMHRSTAGTQSSLIRGAIIDFRSRSPGGRDLLEVSETASGHCSLLGGAFFIFHHRASGTMSPTSVGRRIDSGSGQELSP